MEEVEGEGEGGQYITVTKSEEQVTLGQLLTSPVQTTTFNDARRRRE